ncbi:hypothetical protein I4U23_028710 [Adineta vaga]|nr:hypothetical protein I4U23_028710 [Adineta vaga]
MESLLSQTSVLIRELQNDLLSYENSQDRTNDSSHIELITNKIQRLLEICDRLDIHVNKEPAQRRAQSRQRVNEIKYDIRHYKVCKTSQCYYKHLIIFLKNLRYNGVFVI